MNKRGRTRPAEAPALVNVRLIGKPEAVAALAESLRLVASVQADSGNKPSRKSGDDVRRYIAVIVKVKNDDGRQTRTGHQDPPG